MPRGGWNKGKRMDEKWGQDRSGKRGKFDKYEGEYLMNRVFRPDENIKERVNRTRERILGIKIKKDNLIEEKAKESIFLASH